MATSKARGATRGLTKLEGALKLRYLGIGFIWAWIYGAFETSAVYPDRTGVGINADGSWIVSATVVVAAMFATGFYLSRRPGPPPASLAPLSAGAATLGTLLSALAPPGIGAVSLVLSGILTGFGTGALYVLWGQALVQLDTESAEVAIPASSLIMFGGTLVLPYLPGFVGLIATASLPLLSGICLGLTYRDVLPLWHDERGNAASDPSPARNARTAGNACVAGNAPLAGGGARKAVAVAPVPASIIRISILAFLSYFAIGCRGVLQTDTDAPFIVFGLDLPTLIGSAGGIALVVCFVFFAARPRFDALFRLVAPMVTGAIILLPWADLWALFLTSSLASLADVMLTIATVLFVVDAARRGLVNGALGVGVTQGSLQFGVLLGNVAGRALGNALPTLPSGLFSVSLGLAAFFALSWLFFPAEREMAHGNPPAEVGNVAAGDGVSARAGSGSIGASDASAEVGDASAAASEQVDAPGFAQEGSIERACDRLAAEYGLSGREREILGYLARGRSQPYIREELVLSKNTVATHVKHIYQKLDVHSRQELLDLFE